MNNPTLNVYVIFDRNTSNYYTRSGRWNCILTDAMQFIGHAGHAKATELGKTLNCSFSIQLTTF
jgi:hypothetical protein